jgi:uncharacterized protein YjaG (DUF416 family)
MPNNREIKEHLRKYKALYQSLAEANKRQTQTILELQNQVSTLSSNLVNAQKAVDINKGILRSATEGHNLKEQELISLLTGMKAKLREMGYNGNYDNLGN